MHANSNSPDAASCIICRRLSAEGDPDWSFYLVLLLVLVLEVVVVVVVFALIFYCVGMVVGGDGGGGGKKKGRWWTRDPLRWLRVEKLG